MIAEIKEIIENYLNNRRPATILVGTWTGGKMVLNEKSYVPASLLTGALKGSLRDGDKVRLLRSDGGGEYFILEIIGFSPALKGRDV